MRLGEGGQTGAVGRVQGGISAQQYIRAGIQQVHHRRALFLEPGQPAQDLTQRRDQGEQGGVQHMAFRQVHDGGAALGVQADHHGIAGAAQSEVHAPA